MACWGSCHHRCKIDHPVHTGPSDFFTHEPCQQQTDKYPSRHRQRREYQGISETDPHFPILEYPDIILKPGEYIFIKACTLGKAEDHCLDNGIDIQDQQADDRGRDKEIPPEPFLYFSFFHLFTFHIERSCPAPPADGSPVIRVYFSFASISFISLDASVNPSAGEISPFKIFAT